MKKQNMTLEILALGFSKKDFTLKKVGGYLTMIVTELSVKTFELLKVASKHNVDLVKDGYTYSAQSLYSELGLKCDITTVC